VSPRVYFENLDPDYVASADEVFDCICVFSLCLLTHVDLLLFFLFSLTLPNLLPSAKVAIRFITDHQDELHILVIMLLQSLQLCRVPRSILLQIACFYQPLREKVDLARLLLVDQRKDFDTKVLSVSDVAGVLASAFQVLIHRRFLFLYVFAINFLPFAVFGIDQSVKIQYWSQFKKLQLMTPWLSLLNRLIQTKLWKI
jgi:hypothetical protein